MDSPVIDSDREKYAHHAEELRRAVRAAAPLWLDRVLEPLAGRDDSDDRRRAIAATLEAIDRQLGDLAAADPDVPMSGPLELIRQSTEPVQAWLSAQGVVAPARDAWDVRSSPGDLYSLGPMTFSDLGDDVHVAGITWGAAKAHIHLQRRSQQPDDPSA